MFSRIKPLRALRPALIQRPVLARPQTFWGTEVSKSPPTVNYKEVMETEAGVAEMTRKIAEDGFVMVEGTPYDDPDKTKQLLERIAFIRETHYGGFYDFIPDLAMADTAYTNLALPAHTDTTYFSDPAGLQAFHMLSHEPAPGSEAVSGGMSLLVDGFKAAQVLAEEDPSSIEVLASVLLPFHASGNKGITIAPYKRFPVLEMTGAKRVTRVRWNNDDRGVVPFNKKFGAMQWYRAAQKFDEILRRKEMEYWVQLEPGRVLINRDDFTSRYRNLNFAKEQIDRMVIG
ncbi:hypothetical protein N0V88_002291 [Collariella sp. IMI 366227]|nr:hypothetical protein N0V88_002291 [Collariella sp. IMI 366227]